MLVENSSIPKPFHTQPCKVKHKYALGFDGHRKPLGKASEWTTGKLVLDSWSSITLIFPKEERFSIADLAPLSFSSLS